MPASTVRLDEAPPSADAPTPEVTEGRAVRLRGRRYPVLLPRWRDPRMHVAAVIVTVQVLGQVALGFDVSIAQILICLGICALIEVPLTMWEKGVIAWPASALLTANGTALILRTPGTEHGDWWSTNGWAVFAAAAALGLLSKYAIRIRGRHVFNPSNLGLVVTFLVLGAVHADPQDLWWGDWSVGLALTVAVIVVGGITLAWRLHVFDVALTFWVALAASAGVVALAGHTITARWSVTPVSGWQYWTVFVTSPEIVIFLFFMITDPRTAPRGRRDRIGYAAATGVLAGLLAAPQTTEFATKVSLLAALAIVCAALPVVDALRARRSADAPARVPRVPRPLAFGVLGIVLVVALVAAGAPAREAQHGLEADVADQVRGERPVVELPKGAVPEPSLATEVRGVQADIDRDLARRITRDLVEDLAIEDDALRRSDVDLAATASFGERLAATRRTIEGDLARGAPRSERWDVDDAEIVLLRDPVSPQAIPQIGVAVRGTVTEVRDLDAKVTREQGRSRSSRARVFLMVEARGHYLIGQDVPLTHRMVLGGPPRFSDE